tara:strand:- start:30 stop:875 length:846 start_codon:yes stop_codon:yes gene_type:complete
MKKTRKYRSRRKYRSKRKKILKKRIRRKNRVFKKKLRRRTKKIRGDGDKPVTQEYDVDELIGIINGVTFRKDANQEKDSCSGFQTRAINNENCENRLKTLFETALEMATKYSQSRENVANIEKVTTNLNQGSNSNILYGKQVILGPIELLHEQIEQIKYILKPNNINNRIVLATDDKTWTYDLNKQFIECALPFSDYHFEINKDIPIILLANNDFVKTMKNLNNRITMCEISLINNRIKSRPYKWSVKIIEKGITKNDDQKEPLYVFFLECKNKCRWNNKK